MSSNSIITNVLVYNTIIPANIASSKGNDGSKLQ